MSPLGPIAVLFAFYSYSKPLLNDKNRGSQSYNFGLPVPKKCVIFSDCEMKLITSSDSVASPTHDIHPVAL